MTFSGLPLKEGRSPVNNPTREDPGQVGPAQLKMEAVCLGGSLGQQLLLAHFVQNSVWLSTIYLFMTAHQVDLNSLYRPGGLEHRFLCLPLPS